MQPLTNFLEPVRSPWLFRVSQKIFSVPPIASHAAAKDVTSDQRRVCAERAASSLDQATARMVHGFCPMKNGADKQQDWRAKAYVNITEEELVAQVTGPLGSRDEAVRLNVAIRPGYAIVACSVAVQGIDKPRFLRGFTSAKHGTKGIVFAGLCAYVPCEMPACAPAAAPRGENTPTTRSRTARAKVVKQRKDRLRQLNDAYTDLADEPFADLKELLDISKEEEKDLYSMRPAKRRKVQVAFNLLAKCDDDLYELARGIADDASEDENDDSSTKLVAARPVMTQRRFEEQLARSGKCVCGAPEEKAGKKMVGLKMVPDDWSKEGKMLKGKKAPLL